MSRLTEAARDPNGCGLLLGGAPGTGKSRLLRECLAALDTDALAVWAATATAATTGLALGGLSQVLPAEQPAGDPTAGLLRWAIDTLHKQAAGRPIVLAIDDAHLLDPLSAALVYYIARTGHAAILATVRTGEPVPDPIRALWTDDLVERIELGPLTGADITELLGHVLGGPVDSTSVDRLRHLSQGNAMLLRELVTAARSSGDLSESYGIWRWTGRFTLAPTLAEAVDARIGQLTPEVRAVLEVVAYGEPISLRLLVQATDAAAVEAAEERELIRVRRDDRRTNVRLAHPLYGEVVRQRCPVTRRRRLLADLADLVDAVGARRRDDLLRVAVWRLDSDTADDPARLLGACRQAFADYDIPLATRLARATVDAGGGFEAAEILGTLLMFADRPAEALAVLDAATPPIDDARRRGRWVGIRAIVTYWGLSDVGTVEHLGKESAALTDPVAGNWVRAVESIIRLHHGEHAAALGLARGVLTDRHSDAGTRALAASTIGHLEAARGTPVQTLRSMAAVDADAPRWRADAPYLQLAVELARGTAAILAGDLAAVDTMVTAEFAELADAGEFRLGSGYVMLVRAQAARLRGQLRDAGRYAGTAAATLATSRVYGGLANAERAHIAALSGQTALAAEAIAEADRAHQPTMTVLYPWLEQARSWVATATGDRTAGAEVLHRLVRRLRADRFAAHELHALYDLVRLGHAAQAVGRMTDLAPAVEGPLPALMARHARAAADADGDGLLAVAEEFAELGLTLYAAEATAAAIPLLRAGRAPRTSSATELLATLVARCDGVGTVTLAVTQPSLTGRERQIARLAAAGVASKEIADQLYLSARTVDNHLLRVYAKLGIAGRAELAVALRAVPADAS